MGEAKPIRKAAAVILLRDGAALEVLLAGRSRSSTFMSRAYVFPGGAESPADAGDLRRTAIRELYEEAGVLLASGLDRNEAQALREKRDDSDFWKYFDECGGVLSIDALQFYSRWITPSIESRRFDATFYLAACPSDQDIAIDTREIVDAKWLTIDAALDQAKALRLPPPQLRTLFELSRCDDVAAALALGRTHEQTPAPIMPNAIQVEDGFALALPWDADYPKGDGECLALPDDHKQAWGPSRFVMVDGAWSHI